MNNSSTPTCEAASPRENRVCPRCNGAKIIHDDGFTFEGRYYPARDSKCCACDGRGFFEAPDFKKIIGDIAGRKGLRTKRPDDNRAYYVWRMARFHGGADVTMPMTAMTLVSRDPFVKDLDALADKVANHVFGTDKAAAYRWGNLLVGTMTPPAGMPASAREGGPVCDENKPEEEFLELR